MLASAFDRLSMHEPPANSTKPGIFQKAQEALPKPGTGRGSTPAWRSPWVLHNVFLSIGALDDARIWSMLSAWLSRFFLSSFLVYVPWHDTLWQEVWGFLFTWWAALWPPDKSTQEQTASVKGDDRQRNVAYAYWLFSQDKHVRTITGSMVANQGVADEVTLAGCRCRNLYFAAKAYMSTLTEHVTTNLKEMGHIRLTFITR
jgi:hypothetical protein